MLILSLICLAAPAVTVQEGKLLSGVPDSALTVVHCLDMDLLRTRMERNRWFQFMQTPVALDIISGLISLDSTPNGWRDARDVLVPIGSALHGESVLFADTNLIGFLTQRPHDVAALDAAMRKWIPDPNASYVSQTILDDRVTTVTLFEQEDMSKDSVAIVHHPNTMGLFMAPSECKRSLMEGIKTSFSRLTNGRSANVVIELDNGRHRLGQRGLVEAYVDFTSAILLAEMITGISPWPEWPSSPDQLPPSYFLSPGGHSGLFLSLDLQAGTHVDVRGHLTIPAGSVASQFADCFKPIPQGTAQAIPHSASAYAGTGIDLASAYSLSRSILEELEHDETLSALDQGLEGGEAMTGVDLEQGVFEQVVGPLAWMMIPEAEHANLPGFSQQLMSIGVKQGEVFQEALEALVPFGEELMQIELTDLYGIDTYVFTDRDDLDGGIAFLPNTFLVGLSRVGLRLGVAAGLGEEENRAPSAVQTALMTHPGVCGLGTVLPESLSDLSKDMDEEAKSMLKGTQLTFQLRRVKGGFDLNLSSL